MKKKSILQQDIRGLLGLQPKISQKNKLRFLRALTNLMSASIPVLEALRLMRTKVKDDNLVMISDALRADVEKGLPLSHSMKKFPYAFNGSTIGLVEAGEKTGTIEHSLRRLTENLEKEVTLRSKVTSTLLYPAIIMTLLVGVMAIIVFYVLPTLSDVFTGQGVPLPGGLLFSKYVFDTVSAYWWFILLVIIAVSWAFGYAYKNKPEFAYKIQYALLRAAIYGNIIRKSTIVMFSITFSTLLESGMPIIHSLDILASAQRSLPYKRMLLEMKHHITQGKKISESITSDLTLIPEDVHELIAIGEKTASLQDMFLKIAKQYDFELEMELKNITTLIEPISLLFVAILIGFFAFTILGSIFDLLNTLA